MSVITVAQADAYAQQAGFSGTQVAVIVAIAQAESGLNTAATSPPNTDGSIDRGIVQINNRAHPEVSDACAYDPGCAFKAAYTISDGGTNFTPWTTYQTGAYLKYTTTTPIIAQTTSGTPWYMYPFGELFGQGYNGTTEHGTDFEVPPETPITALLAGTITYIGQPAWGIEVTWKLDQPWNGIPYAYQIHLDAINPVLHVGSHINAGDLIGWSGGENSLGQLNGATNPTGTHFVDSASYSSGPHTEFGFSFGPQFGTGAGWSSDPSLNPLGFLNEVRSGAIPEPAGIGSPTGSGNGNVQLVYGQQPSSPTIWSTAPLALTGANDAFLTVSQNTHQILSSVPGFYGICMALDEAEQFPGIYNAFSGDTNPLNWGSDATMTVLGTISGNLLPFAFRAMLIVLGFVILAGLMWNATEPYLGSVLDLAGAAA